MDESGMPERAIARRRSGDLLFGGHGLPAPFTADVEPPEKHIGSRLAVYHEIVWPMITEDGRLKGPPQLHIRWNFHNGSQRVVAFRRKDGFGSPENPGTQIIDTRGHWTKVECLDPGEYFYTFHTVSGFLGLLDFSDIQVQFSRTIPNIDDVLKVMKQAVAYEETRKKYEELTLPPKLPEPPPKPEDPELKWRRELMQGLANVSSRLEVAEKFHAHWAELKKKIRSGPGSAADKKKQMDHLDDLMKRMRETFQL